jgi:hypothetical protein
LQCPVCAQNAPTIPEHLRDFIQELKKRLVERRRAHRAWTIYEDALEPLPRLALAKRVPPDIPDAPSKNPFAERADHCMRVVRL